MANYSPPNGSPTTILLGTKDSSRKRLVYEPPRMGIHIPIVFFWAEYGPTDAQLIHGDTFALTYGDKTLDGRSKFANHVTPYLVDVFLPNANTILAKRLLPKDIGPKASLRVYVDIVEEEFDEYERNIDGSFKRDALDNLVPTGAKVNGLLVKFGKELIPTDPLTKITAFNKGTIRTGTMVNSKGANSTIYPLFDFIAPHFGSIGNNTGIRLWAPTNRDLVPVKKNLIEEDNVYPFRMAMARRNDKKGNAKIIRNLYGEFYDDFCLKPDMVDTAYNKDRYLEHVGYENYQDLMPVGSNPVKYGPLGGLKVYEDNVKHVLTMMLEKESAMSYPTNSLAGKGQDPEAQDFYLVNLLGLQNPDGSPYQALRFDTSSFDGIRFTENTTLWLDGADDGTLTDAEFADLVELELEEMGDPDSPYQDINQYYFSAFWDTGFPLQTKYKMGNVIAQRKNTNVYVSNYISGEPPLTMSEESSRHIAIVERLRTYIESDYFATPTFRGVNIMASTKMLSSTWRKRVSCNIELANMISKLAAGHAFNEEAVFDRPPANVFDITRDVSIVWAPRSVRIRDWDMGMMYPELLEQRKPYFSASRTVYKDDTSVLTSVINAIIVAELETVGILAQKYFSGRLTSQNVLKEELEDWVNERVEGRFAGLIRFKPNVYFTDADNARGYSWTLQMMAWLNNGKTVQTQYVEVFRIDDLKPGNTSFVA